MIARPTKSRGEQSRINATLIAAAPDLLNALMLARTHIENDLNDRMAKRADSDLDIIDAAIAKALGKAQEG